MTTPYQDVAIFSLDGVCAKLTSRRKPNGIVQYSYSFYREYEKDGETRTVMWFDPRHVGAFAPLADMVQERINLERDRSRKVGSYARPGN